MPPTDDLEVTFVTLFSGLGGLTLLSSSLYTRLVAITVRVSHGTLRAVKVRKANVSPTETTSSTRREIAVEIPVEEVNRETASLIQKYQKLARIPGFRRGHVPASIIKQRFSEDLKSDVVEALVPRYFRKEADKQGLIPVSQPQVTDLHLKDNEPLRFKASFEVMPEIKVEGYKELRAEKPDITVTDEEVEQSLTACASSTRPTRRSKAGPWPTATTPRFRSMASPKIEDADSKPVHMDEVMVEIAGKNTMPEFTENLRGASAGDERVFEVVYAAGRSGATPGGKDLHLHGEGAVHQAKDPARTE